MVKAIRHDPYSLFRFALRESDWVLAQLLARRLGSSEPGRVRLVRELAATGSGAGKPGSLAELRRLARLSRRLELDNGGD